MSDNQAESWVILEDGTPASVIESGSFEMLVAIPTYGMPRIEWVDAGKVNHVSERQAKIKAQFYMDKAAGRKAAYSRAMESMTYFESDLNTRRELVDKWCEQWEHKI